MPLVITLLGGLPVAGFVPTLSLAAAQDLGTDFSCYPDLDPSFSIISGNRVVAEMAIRRITTRRGSVADDPNFGTDIRDYLNDAMQGLTGAQGQTTLYRMKTAIEKEIRQDQRVDDCTATVTFNQFSTATLPANSVRIGIVIATKTGTFTLELGVTGLTLPLLSTG